MPVGVIGGEEIPFFPKLTDQGISDGVDIHRCRVAHAEDVPVAVLAGDDVGVAAGDDMQHVLLRSHPCHSQRDAGVHVADDARHLIALNELARLLHTSADVVGRIFNQHLQLATKYAALLIDVLKRKLRALNLALRNSRINAGERIDETNFYGGFAASLDEKWRGNLCSTHGSGTAENCAAVHFAQDDFRHTSSPCCAKAPEVFDGPIAAARPDTAHIGAQEATGQVSCNLPLSSLRHHMCLAKTSWVFGTIEPTACGSCLSHRF